MRTVRLVSLAAFLITVAVFSASAQSTKAVRSLEIRSGWGGLGTPQQAVVTIKRKDGKYVSRGRSVSSDQVESLLSALTAQPVANPEMTNLGITPTWLRTRLAAQRPRAWAQATETTTKQRQMFDKAFTDPAVIAKALPSLFAYTKFDDYPGASVEVVFEDGSKLRAGSHSYYAFMLPWKVSGHKTDTYNAAISRAVSALLPANSVNKKRLTGAGLAEELTESVMRLIEREWNLQGSNERAGEALHKLRTVYQVVTAEFTPYHHPEYGTATYKGEPEEMNLHASLRRSTFPSNVTDALVLRQTNGKVEGVDEFLSTSAKYEKLALSVPWLNQYIRENPRVAFRISYVHNQSLGEKAMRVFTADMKLRGREDLIEQVKAQQADIVLLIVGTTYLESYWLLFPDKHMMLWRHDGPSGLLKFKPEDFGKGKCSEYEKNDGGCSGREVTPEGALSAEQAPVDQVCMAKNYSAKVGADALQGSELFRVMDRGRAGFIDRTGKVVIPLCFEVVGDFSEGLARFERDGRWGYIDTRGSVVIEPKFPWAEDFFEGLAQVQLSGSSLGYDGRWGFIDKTGAVVIPVGYKAGDGMTNSLSSHGTDAGFHDGRAKIESNGKNGYIDKTGKLVIPAEFTFAYPFSEGLAAVTKSTSGDDGWGYIDTSGKWVVEPQFEWGSSFSAGLAPVNRRHNCGYIDRTGKMMLQPPVPPAEDCAGVWGDFVEGLSRWRLGKKYGYIDRTGKVAIEPEYDLTFHFSEGLAAVGTGGEWGYIDKSGDMVVKPRKLRRAEDFHNGLAYVVTEDGRHGYIDTAGKFVWTPTRLYADTK